MHSAVLERPIWTSLSANHKTFAVGTKRAMRFSPEVSSLGAIFDDSDESLVELGELVSKHGSIITGQTTPINCPPGTRLTSELDFCQMRADTLLNPTVADHPVERLDAQDADEMLALAQLTKPGPFSLRTHRLGEYWGIRSEGKLVAMAGERLKQGAFVEVSGVCTHPDFVGQGMALSLCWKLTQRIFKRQATAYLHVASANEGAISVYRKLGYRLHQPIVVTVIEPTL